MAHKNQVFLSVKLSLVQLFEWLVSLSLRLKLLWHVSHLKGRSPE